MVTDISSHRRAGVPHISAQEIVSTARKMGAVNAKVIQSHTIFLGNWTRLKCQFGCPHFGRTFTCPTFTPTTQEMSDILLDYEKAVVVEAKQAADVHRLVLALETHFREMGFNKASLKRGRRPGARFALFTPVVRHRSGSTLTAYSPNS